MQGPVMQKRAMHRVLQNEEATATGKRYARNVYSSVTGAKIARPAAPAAATYSLVLPASLLTAIHDSSTGLVQHTAHFAHICCFQLGS
jgi:hypothetical protein